MNILAKENTVRATLYPLPAQVGLFFLPYVCRAFPFQQQCSQHLALLFKFFILLSHFCTAPAHQGYVSTSRVAWKMSLIFLLPQGH